MPAVAADSLANAITSQITNLCNQPGFEYNLTNVGVGVTGGSTNTRVAGGESGSWSMQSVAAGADTGPAFRWTGAVGKTYRISFWMKGDGSAVQCLPDDYASGQGTGSTIYGLQVTSTTSWQRVSSLYVPIVGPNLGITFRIRTNGGTVQFDDIMIVDVTGNTSSDPAYFDGDSGPDYSWLGTVGSSQSAHNISSGNLLLVSSSDAVPVSFAASDKVQP